MLIQWYPGHMAKAKRVIGEQMKVIDVVVELRDARIPLASENPLLQELIQNKPRILALNKADLADPQASRAWAQYFRAQGVRTVLLDSKAKAGRKLLIREVLAAGQPMLERWRRRGLRTRSVRTIILGIPNVGKSTLINTLAKSYIAHTADRPGKTRGQQWVRLADGLELMDTPGVLWPKIEDPAAARKLAATGAILDEVFDAEDVVRELLGYLALRYGENLAARYDLTAEQRAADPDAVLAAIAQRRGALLPGGIADLDKARRLVLNDFRNCRLGQVTLELPSEEPEVADE